jgi:hypothetical protein
MIVVYGRSFIVLANGVMIVKGFIVQATRMTFIYRVES